MIKKIVIIVCVLVIVVAAVVFLGVWKLGPVIKLAVNTYGPQITKTDVSVSDVGVSILKGQVKLKGFVLGNPKGFKAPHAFRVNLIYVDVDEKSFTGDTIVIEQIEVVAPEINYEKTLKSDNIQKLMENIKGANTSTAKSSKEKTDDVKGENGSGEKKIIIRDFYLKGAKVNLTASVLGQQTVSAKIPEIHLKDLGKDQGGITPEKAFSKIFAAVYKELSSPEITRALTQGLKDLGDNAKKQLEKAGEDLKTAAEADARQKVEDLQKDLGSEIEGVSKGLEGFLGK